MNEERPLLRLLPALGALMLTLLAFALRLHRLDFQPLWGDEGWSFYFASMGLGDMIRLTAEDIHPPLYYALLGGWLWLVGSTPELARFLSILFGTALVPLAYRLACRLYDRVVGLAMAAIVTVAPFAIYYSQEVRMYGLVTLLGLASVYFFVELMDAGEGPTTENRSQTTDNRSQTTDSGQRTAGEKRSTRYAVGYVLVTAGALYTMYYAVFIPVVQVVYFVATNRRRKLVHVIWHPFVRSLSVALLLYLPWIVFVGAKLAAYVQGKRVAEGYIPLDLLRFVASHLVAFSVGHLSDATRILAWSTLLFLPVALLGLFYRSPRTTYHTSRNTHYAIRIMHHALLVVLYLLVPLLLGYLINLVYPFIPRYFERTLMLVAPAWWLLLGAGLAWFWRRSRLILVAVAAAMLLVQMVMLLDFYNAPRYRDEDYRPLLAYVRAHSSPEDAFLASYQWQVGFYHAYLPPPRPALYEVPGWGETWSEDTAKMHTDLDVLIGSHPHLWFPAYQALGRLWEGEVEAYLNRTAFPAQVDWRLPSTKLLLYAQGDQLAPADAPVNFANRLQVERVEVGNSPVEAGRGVVPVTLMWRKLGSLGSDHRVALRLTDADGRTWATRDSLPLGGDASFTDLRFGESLVDRHGLIIPAGTPPGDYQLRLGVYDQASDRPLDVLDDQSQPQGVEAVLATIRVILPRAPLPPDALPVQFSKVVDFDGQVRLLGYSLGNGPFQAGESLKFSLFWQSLANGDEPYVVFAQLQDETGRPGALSETPLIYPSDRWTDGTLLRDPHQISLPATLPPGTYRLAVGLLRSDGSRLPVARGDDQVVLASVETTQRFHDFSPPAPQHVLGTRFGDYARLVGYDLRGGASARPGETLTLVLYWEALETFDRSYTVFAHLVDADDDIFGQRDQVPGNGDYPTTSWVPGEYLADAYAIPVSLDIPSGEYWIEIGFYDPLDNTRLPVTNAEGEPLGDRLLLEESRIRIGE